MATAATTDNNVNRESATEKNGQVTGAKAISTASVSKHINKYRHYDY